MSEPTFALNEHVYIEGPGSRQSGTVESLDGAEAVIMLDNPVWRQDSGGGWRQTLKRVPVSALRKWPAPKVYPTPDVLHRADTKTISIPTANGLHVLLRAGESLTVAWPDGETQVITPRVAVVDACPHCRAPYVPHVTGCVNRCTGGQGWLCSCTGSEWASKGRDGCPLCYGTGVIRPKAGDPLRKTGRFGELDTGPAPTPAEWSCSRPSCPEPPPELPPSEPAFIACPCTDPENPANPNPNCRTCWGLGVTRRNRPSLT